MKKNIIITVAFMLLQFIFSYKGISQVNNPISDIFLPSPNAGHLGSFAKMHVNKHVGALQLSIPLDTIEAGDISMLLALNYHSTGVKSNQPASWEGMDWNLLAGGVITREVVGKHDEFQTDEWSQDLGFFVSMKLKAMVAPSSLSNRIIILTQKPLTFLTNTWL